MSVSLRNWVGLIVAAALLGSPLLNYALLQLFPPPDLMFRGLPPPPGERGPLPGQAPRVAVAHFGLSTGPGPGLLGGPSSFTMALPARVAGSVAVTEGGPRTRVMLDEGPAVESPDAPRRRFVTALRTHDGAADGPKGGVMMLGGPEHEAAIKAMRRHFTMINLATIGILMLTAVLLLTLLLRRPVRRLIESIGDIERGAAPSAEPSGPREFRQIGGALQRMSGKLRGSLRERELMLAGLSHDIRSPLARLQAAIELHAADHPGDFQPMMTDIRDIDHIVHQCIDFVRDGQDEPLETLELDALVRTALQRHDGLQLDLRCPGEQVSVRRLGLLRLVRNLADNALVHGAAPVRVTTHAEGGMLRLSVEDHGRGIESQEWQRLTEPFERGNRARDGRGAGLGLAIVQRVAHAHGARVELRERRADRPFAVELCLPLTA
ncbi:hypothetical protein D0B54_15260 [Solimonas sp. K1W22B-7]|uniref:ATP-binding protein n=1 Tax=Solimonas sp. K1W22B-7 TaxID=2303331 RepID=UPI000E337C2D|nr:ATP-binding protein [Solimonas sp. K1W22B-7]AXQ29952.1 hypothetical protein D0B54_15260 [Solimonas sp. K1W22B-7]